MVYPSFGIVGQRLDIKHRGEYVEYDRNWVEEELRRDPTIPLPEHVFKTIVHGWYPTLASRFDLFNAKNFKERLMIAAIMPTGEAYGSNCFGTALYLAGLIPCDILIDGKKDVRKEAPGIEDYVGRLKEVDSLNENVLIAYYQEGNITHAIYWERERNEFFDRMGLWQPLRGYKALPESKGLEVRMFDVSQGINFSDLFPRSLKDAHDCIARSHSLDD